MTMTRGKGTASFWIIQIPGWLLLVYLVIAQGVTAFSYELGVSMGAQEPAEAITEVGVAFWYGFALGDLLIYIPLLFAGLIGHILGRQWGNVGLAAALGITIYWPIVCLAAMVDARDAAGWNLSSEMQYWVGCLLIAAWGAWGLIYLMKESRHA